jgi:hypothetical protein
MFLLAAMLYSCKDIYVDESYKNSGKPKEVYKEIIDSADQAVLDYNKFLKSKVNKAFLNEFYFNNEYHFDVTCIFCSVDNSVLVYIKRNFSDKNSYNVQYTKENPLYLLVSYEGKFSLPSSYLFDPVVLSRQNAYTFITQMSFDKLYIPFWIRENAKIATFQISIRPRSFDRFIYFPGIILISKEKSFGKLVKESLKDACDLEIKDKYISSKYFKEAMIHPILKDYALKIKQKQAASKAKEQEYPIWEFEKDLQEMRKIAKKAGLANNYVDEMIKDPQYEPITGKLLYYYSDKLGFMWQWSIINSGLFLFVIVLCHFFPSICNSNSYLILMTATIVTINKWVYDKATDIDFIYWVIPGLLFIASFLFVFHKKSLLPAHGKN